MLQNVTTLDGAKIRIKSDIYAFLNRKKFRLDTCLCYDALNNGVCNWQKITDNFLIVLR